MSDSPFSNQLNKPPLVILTGPTAVGKTALSIALAKAIGGEIISADSMQIYKHMDIGSAKIMPEEMEGIPHYLVDELEPSEEFNVAIFQEKAKTAMAQIYANGHIPIIVGGTGFYIQALVYDADFAAEDDLASSQLRAQLEKEANDLGAEAMHERLAAVDQASASLIHPNNVKRVIRALEYFQLHGRPISESNATEKAKDSPYNFALFVLNDERDRLYSRIDQRVDLMLENGLIEEVTKLKAMGYDRSFVSMQGLGYKEVLAYLEGECTLDEAIYIIKRDTRHFAKRQLTWFRPKTEARWLNKNEFNYNEDKILQEVLNQLKEQGIITC